MNEKIYGALGKFLAFIILVYTLLPIFVIIISAFNASHYFSFPPEGFTLKWFGLIPKSQEYQTAVRISVLVAATAAMIALLAGVSAAFALNRYEFPGNAFLQGIFLSPLLLPQIIWAIALVQFYAAIRIGDANVLGTFPGLVLAHSVIIIPYVVRMVLASLSFVDIDIENAARSLGATPQRTFVEITLPIIMPGVIVSAVFGFMISFTDVVVSSFIAGTRYITFPVRIYSELRSEGLDPLAIALSAVVMTVIVVLALIGEKTIRWSRFV